MLPPAAILAALQLVPVLDFFLGIARAEFWPGAPAYAAAAGVGIEALTGRTSARWLALPAGAALLSIVPHQLEEGQIAGERVRAARIDQPGFGPGADQLGVVVDTPETARILALRYDVAFAAASRTSTSVDLVLYRRAPGAGNRLTGSALPEEPSRAIVMGGSIEPFQRGRITGYDHAMTARWPDGRERSRFGIWLYRIGTPAFPIIGREPGQYLSQKPFGIRWARPVTQSIGYDTPADPATRAAIIARLIGLVPLSPDRA